MIPKMLVVITLLIAIHQPANASYYEPPVEGGPKVTQGSGSR